MENYQLTYKPYGNSAILIEWPQNISLDILQDIRQFVDNIIENNFKVIVDLNFVYSSLLITYDSLNIDYVELKDILMSIYKSMIIKNRLKTYVWNIPVCYDSFYGIDLSYLASEKKCSIEEIVSLHTTSDYTVFGIGFLPGFLYLGGLSEKLHTKRRNTPRLAVQKGAVAIGGNQTGIYPQSSPGGWHIIGNTPITLFDANKDTPSMIAPGDTIKFQAITKKAFDNLIKAQKSGNYELKRNLNA